MISALFKPPIPSRPENGSRSTSNVRGGLLPSTLVKEQNKFSNASKGPKKAFLLSFTPHVMAIISALFKPPIPTRLDNATASTSKRPGKAYLYFVLCLRQCSYFIIFQ